MTTILALDLGTQMGWATNAQDMITSGSQSFKGDRFSGGGMRYLKFTKWLDDFNGTSNPSMVLFEEVRRHLGVDAAHVYGGFLSHLQAWCTKNEVPYQGVPVGTIKKHATGKGNASKDQMIGAAESIKGYEVEDDNEADAVCLLAYGIEQFGSKTKRKRVRVKVI